MIERRGLIGGVLGILFMLWIISFLWFSRIFSPAASDTRVQDLALTHCGVLYIEYDAFTAAIENDPDCRVTWLWSPANENRQGYSAADRDTLSTTFDKDGLLVVYDEMDQDRIQSWRAMISIDTDDTDLAQEIAENSIQYLKERFWSSIKNVAYVFPETKLFYDYVITYSTDVWMDIAAISRYLQKNERYTKDGKDLLQVSPDVMFGHNQIIEPQTDYSTQALGTWVLDQWYLSYISHPEAMECIPRWKPIKIAVVDNGFDLTHPDISWVISAWFDEADKDPDAQIPKIEKSWNHGTKESWIIGAEHNDFGITWIYPNAELILVKATKDSANGRDITNGIEAIAKAYELGADVINLSWWGFDNVQMLEKVTKKISEKWVIIVAAAWNYNKSKPFYPAAYPRVVWVAAIDDEWQKASFSNYGSWIDIAAPWVGILTTDLENTYDKYSGTSEASPIVAGSIALALSLGLEIEDIMEHTKKVEHQNFGAGILDIWFLCDIDFTTQDSEEIHNAAWDDWFFDTISQWMFVSLVWLLIFLLWCFGWIMMYLRK